MATGCDLDPGNLRGLRGQHGTYTSIQTLGCGRAMDLEMVLGSNLDPDVSIIRGGSAGHLKGYDPCGSNCPWTQTGSEVVAQTPSICVAPGSNIGQGH